MSKIKHFGGLKANLPSSGLTFPAYYQCIDTGELFLAVSATKMIQVGKGINMQISSLTSNPSSIALDSTAARTYQDCIIFSQTSITLSGGNANPGYEHYLLFYNVGDSDCVITPASGMIAPSTITVKAGKCLEISWIYIGSAVIITNSTEIGLRLL